MQVLFVAFFEINVSGMDRWFVCFVNYVKWD